MSLCSRISIAVLSCFLACGAAAPVLLAQSGSSPNILYLNSSGSYLGIEMDDVTSANMSKLKLSSEKGVIVRSVVKGSPAEEAGLHEDDVILDYAGFPVWSASSFSRLVSETPAGRKVELGVLRDGKRISITAKIGTRSGEMSRSRIQVLPRGGENGDLLERFFALPRPDQRGNILALPAEKPRLGIALQPLNEQLAETMGVPGKKGVLVWSVSEGSPSAGKLKAGDVIIAADGKEIRNPEELTRIVQDKPEGTLSLKVIRDKKQISVDVKLDPRSTPEGTGYRL